MGLESGSPPWSGSGVIGAGVVSSDVVCVVGAIGVVSSVVFGVGVAGSDVICSGDVSVSAGGWRPGDGSGAYNGGTPSNTGMSSMSRGGVSGWRRQCWSRRTSRRGTMDLVAGL